MKIKSAIITLFFSALLNVNAATQPVCGLQIHLPREATVNDRVIRLGQVSVISGQENLSVPASEVSLGSFSVPGQKILMDRPTILSRLAGSNIAADKVTFTGAEKLIVKWNQNSITAEMLIEQGRLFLQRSAGYLSACEFKPVRAPKDLVIPVDSNEIKFRAELSERSTAGRAYVQVGVVLDGKEIKKIPLSFQIKYRVQKAAAIEEIAAGEIIRPEKIKVVEKLSDKPAPAGWKLPYGLIAKRRIPAGAEIEDDLVADAAKGVVINRNQAVLIKIAGRGLVVQAAGKALEKGGIGELIKVQNTDSGRVIVAKIKEDGTVEPAF